MVLAIWLFRFQIDLFVQMSNKVIKVEDLSKIYRLGQVGTGTLNHDINRWWHKVRGKDDPYLKLGEQNDRGRKGGSQYVWALRDLNFDIENGEVLGLIGRNGAGKSTLLKILSRTTAPTTGTIKIKGRIASLLEVGTGFHPELTGRENVFLNGAILGMTRREISSKFDEIVSFAAVERYIDTPVKRYSSGMYVRLAFAVAANLESEILIVDEVLAVGDVEFQKKCLGKMKDVSQKDGRTVIFVSHNMAAISNLCDNAIVMDNGIISYRGKTKEGIQQYLNSQREYENNSNLNQKISEINSEEFELNDFLIEQVCAEGNNFRNNDSIKVKIAYSLKKRIIGFRIGFDLIDQSNELVLFRTFHDDMSSQIEYYEPGTYTSTVELPSNFFKDGAYIISFLVGIHNVKWISNGKLTFRFNITNAGGVNQTYADNRPGIIMPQLLWKNKNTGND